MSNHTKPRKTKQREAILKVLRSTKSHPTAYAVFEQVKNEIPNISFGTVYRNLRILKKSGEIRELDLAGKPSHFNSDMSEHYHLRCDRCDRVFDLNQPIDINISSTPGKEIGFKVTFPVVELRGLCKDCQA
jgi:Fur family peroxide stress response transcriptional regulator